MWQNKRLKERVILFRVVGDGWRPVSSLVLGQTIQRIQENWQQKLRK